MKSGEEDRVDRILRTRTSPLLHFLYNWHVGCTEHIAPCGSVDWVTHFNNFGLISRVGYFMTEECVIIRTGSIIT